MQLDITFQRNMFHNFSYDINGRCRLVRLPQLPFKYNESGFERFNQKIIKLMNAHMIQHLNPCHGKIYLWKHKNIFVFSVILQHWDSRDSLNPSFLIENKDPFILYSQYECCWWPDNTNSQGISKPLYHRMSQFQHLMHSQE